MASTEKEKASPPNDSMVEKREPQFFSSFLRIGGGIGFAIHLLAILIILIIRPRMVLSIQSFASNLEHEAQKLDLVLLKAEQSLSLASTTLSDSADLLFEAEDLLVESSSLLRSVGELVGQDATETILSTQDALEAAIPASQTVDSMLNALSILEPLTGFSYNPEKSLSQGLNDVSASLEPLPGSLREVQTQLVEAASEIDDLTPGLEAVARDLSNFSDTILGISEQMETGQNSFQLLYDLLDKIQNRVAQISWISTIILSLFLAFGALSQLSTFLVGKQK
jgi:methyl-accepting chemotaxis protein